LESVSARSKVDAQWQAFIAKKKAEELDRIIEEERLKPEETRAFMANAFRDGVVPERGSAITRILPPVSRLTGGSFYTLKKQTVLEKLAAFLERFLGLG